MVTAIRFADADGVPISHWAFQPYQPFQPIQAQKAEMERTVSSPDKLRAPLLPSDDGLPQHMYQTCTSLSAVSEGKLQ